MISPAAKKHLLKSDPHMATLVRSVSIARFVPRPNHFRALVSSIISQQLSTKAAASIKQKFYKTLGTEKYNFQRILDAPVRNLRQAGLSGSKVRYIKALAAAMEAKQLNFAKIKKMDDEQIIAQLTRHHGIGRWTAEMFLIFSLGRPDVFSLGDWGLRSAIVKIYKPKNTNPKTILALAEKWRPYRSAACLYLWASLDNMPK